MVLPQFLVKKTPKQENIRKIRALLNDHCLHSVCESAKCPNIGECFERNTMTFMILGNVCTRHCRFCGIDKGQPPPVDENEPQKVAEAVAKLGLNYVVITSVTRDDLQDGGASHFALVIKAINRRQDTRHKWLDKLAIPAIPREIEGIQDTKKVEVLIPDFQGNEQSLKTVLAANPYVLNHNIETIPRLYSKIRPEASYDQSVKLLERSKQLRPDIYSKSGFMLGLGEEKAEVIAVIKDLKQVNCDLVTIGQYLPPSRNHLPAERYVAPEEFAEYQGIGQNLGIKIFAGPFVRSSYRAGEISQ
ncbi:MAG: lipoyl synthase [Candidatus Margulisiibacteriota bacterium]